MWSIILTLFLVYLGLSFISFVISVLVGLIGKGVGLDFEDTMAASGLSLLIGVAITVIAFIAIGFGNGGNFHRAEGSAVTIFGLSVFTAYTINIMALIFDKKEKKDGLRR
jgi:hypothetical protein